MVSLPNNPISIITNKLNTHAQCVGANFTIEEYVKVIIMNFIVGANLPKEDIYFVLTGIIFDKQYVPFY